MWLRFEQSRVELRVKTDGTTGLARKPAGWPHPLEVHYLSNMGALLMQCTSG
jgi:hypothetical protein